MRLPVLPGATTSNKKEKKKSAKKRRKKLWRWPKPRQRQAHRRHRLAKDAERTGIAVRAWDRDWQRRRMVMAPPQPIGLVPKSNHPHLHRKVGIPVRLLSGTVRVHPSPLDAGGNRRIRARPFKRVRTLRQVETGQRQAALMNARICFQVHYQK